MQPSTDRSFFGHPRGLATLFFTEMWERWSFYGMRSILVPFLAASVATGGLGFDTGNAKSLYHIYLSLIYLMSVPGGWMADRFFGQRRAVLWGGILIMCGHVVLAIHNVVAFFFGLFLVVLGTGLLKPNVSSVVGGLYSRDDARRDAAFSIFYMGINLGSFLGQMAAPFLAQHSAVKGFLERNDLSPNLAWQLGFGSAAVGMLIGVVQYVRGQKNLGSAGDPPPNPASARDWLVLKVGGGIAAVTVLVVVLLNRAGKLTVAGIDSSFGIFLTILTVGFFVNLFMAGQWTPAERRRLFAILVLFVASCLFWSAFEQAGSTLNLFGTEKTSTTLIGIEFPAGWYQNVNSICTILLSPLFAIVWMKLGRRDPSHPAKFALGLLFAGLGFLVMERGAAAWEGAGGLAQGARVSGLFLIVTYFFHSVGEVCLSPVGLSAMTKLAPARVTGLMMGAWFLSISVGSYLGGQLAQVFDPPEDPAMLELDPALLQAESGLSEGALYTTIAAITIGGAVVMLALVPALKRLSASEDA
jgi:POT family proton-dependent oligopeptide transporter